MISRVLGEAAAEEYATMWTVRSYAGTHAVDAGMSCRCDGVRAVAQGRGEDIDLRHLDERDEGMMRRQKKGVNLRRFHESDGGVMWMMMRAGGTVCCLELLA